MTEQLFFDTDCVSSFLWVKSENLLLKLYPGRIVLPREVVDELSNPSINHIKKRINHLITNGDVATQRIYADTEEFCLYYQLAIAPPKGEKIIGKGEAAAISLAKAYKGLLASNNLKDILKYVYKYNLNHITTGDILVTALNEGYIDENTGNIIWNNMLTKKRLLPEASFTKYLKTRQR